MSKKQNGQSPDKHAASIKNLENGKPHRWQPGQSGNPNGRPKSELCLTTKTREYGAAVAPQEAVQALIDRGVIFPEEWTKDGRRINMAELVAARAWHNASLLRGGTILKEIFDRVDGKVPQPIRLSGPDDGPVQVQNFDLKKLSKDELRLWMKLQEKTMIEAIEKQTESDD